MMCNVQNPSETFPHNFTIEGEVIR